MEPRDLGRVIVRGLPAAVVVGLIVAAAALGLALLRHPLYEATSRVFVSTPTATGVQDLNSGGTFTQQIVKSYAEVATSPVVLEPVIRRLDLDESPQQLAKRVTATASLDTVIIDISADDPSPAQARRIADAVTQQLSDVVDSLTTVRADAAAIAITRIQPATVASSPIGLPAAALGVLGLLVGLLIGMVIVLVREAVQRRIRSASDARRASGLPVLAALPRPHGGPAAPISVGTPGSDGYRALRGELMAATDAGFDVGVFGCGSRSGTTTTATNLAISFAESGRRVALVEADLERPSLAHVLDLAAHAGLSEVLADGVPVRDALMGWGEHGMQVLVAGAVPVGASDLLQGGVMDGVMEELTTSFDVVVYDLGSALQSSDAASVASRLSSAVAVCAAGRTRAPMVASSVDTMRRHHVPVVGVVATALPRRGADAPSILT